MSVEILLINLAADKGCQTNIKAGHKGTIAPLGLFCLEAIAPDRIKVIDYQNTLPDMAMINAAVTEQTTTVILQPAPLTNPAFCRNAIEQFRQINSNIKVGCAHFDGIKDLMPDFIVCGSGVETINNILAHNFPGKNERIIEKNDLYPPVPSAMFVDNFGYETTAECWIKNRTIDVFQPWLGLADRSHKIRKFPEPDWLNDLIRWLGTSGFRAFQLWPSALTPEKIHLVRTIMLKHGAKFSASFSVPAAKSFTNCAGEPLKQIWLADITRQNAADTANILSEAAQTGFGPGILLNFHWQELETSVQEKLLAASENFFVVDAHIWSPFMLKKIYRQFWTIKRFARRLSQVKSAAELIAFMKISCAILEIILNSAK